MRKWLSKGALAHQKRLERDSFKKLFAEQAEERRKKEQEQEQGKADQAKPSSY